MDSADINNINNNVVNTVGIFNDNVAMKYIFIEKYFM